MAINHTFCVAGMECSRGPVRRSAGNGGQNWAEHLHGKHDQAAHCTFINRQGPDLSYPGRPCRHLDLIVVKIV